MWPAAAVHTPGSCRARRPHSPWVAQANASMTTGVSPPPLPPPPPPPPPPLLPCPLLLPWPLQTEDGARLTSALAPYIQMEVAVPLDLAGDCLVGVSGVGVGVGWGGVGREHRATMSGRRDAGESACAWQKRQQLLACLMVPAHAANCPRQMFPTLPPPPLGAPSLARRFTAASSCRRASATQRWSASPRKLTQAVLLRHSRAHGLVCTLQTALVAVLASEGCCALLRSPTCRASS